MLLVALFLLLIAQSAALTGSQAASFCHCDLTTSFCDFGCCCDSDCSSSISSDCYNLKSNSYCPDSTFFARLGSSYLNPQGCFYYNSSNTVIEQITLTSSQVTKIINEQNNVSRLAAGQVSTRAGYQIGDALSIGASPTFTFVDSSGSCLTASTAGSASFSLKFGLNMKLSCSNSSTSFPLLYSSFSGQYLLQFSGDSAKKVTVPAISASATSAELKIVIGSYGSAKARYIERVVVSSSTASSSERTLNVWFVQSSELLSVESSPSFFPQIPSDMFYPIYLLS